MSHLPPRPPGSSDPQGPVDGPDDYGTGGAGSPGGAAGQGRGAAGQGAGAAGQGAGAAGDGQGYGQPVDLGPSGFTPASGDIIGSGVEAGRSLGLRQKLAIGGAAAGVLLVGGTAYGAVQFMSGGGEQPDDVLPSSTIAIAKVDFDPSAGQKIAALRLARKIPSLGEGAQGADDDLATTLGRSIDGDNDYGLTYDRDVKPWIGRRFAVAAVPDSSAKDKVAAVLVVSYTDEGKMRATLDKAKARAKADCPTRADCSSDFGYATRGDYVLITQDQAEADRLAKQTSKLSGQGDFQDDVESLDSDQLAVGWVDIKAAYGLASSSDRAALVAQLGTVKPTGRFVVGVHAASDYLEVQGKGRGITQLAKKGQTLAVGKGSGLAGAYPADTQAVLSVTGLGPFASQLYTTYKKQAGLDLEQYAQQLDLQLPGDFEALLGSDLALGGKGGADADALPSGALHVTTDKGTRAVEVLDDLLPQLGQDVKASKTADGYQLTLPSSAQAAFGKPTRTLASTPAFTKAVPDAGTAAAVVYVNIGDLVDRYGDAKDKKDYAHVGAFGMSAKGGPDSSFTVRITTR